MEAEVVLEKYKKSVSTAHLWMHSNDILYIKLDSSRHDSLGVKEATEICEAVVEISNNRRVKFLTDSRGVVGSVEQGARETFRHHPGMIGVRVAEAFIVDSLANKLIIDFYIRYNRPENPTRVFRNVENALEWLESVEISG